MLYAARLPGVGLCMLPHGPEQTKSCSSWCGAAGASEPESDDACCWAHSSTCLASSSLEGASACGGKGEFGDANGDAGA